LEKEEVREEPVGGCGGFGGACLLVVVVVVVLNGTDDVQWKEKKCGIILDESRHFGRTVLRQTTTKWTPRESERGRASEQATNSE